MPDEQNKHPERDDVSPDDSPPTDPFEPGDTPDTPPPAPLPDHVLDPIPPPVEVGTGTEDEQEDESGFIERPPISRQARVLRGMAPKAAIGAVGLGLIAFFLFTNFGDDSQVVSQPDPVVEVEAVVDPEPESATEDQPSEEPASDVESASDEEPVIGLGGDAQADGERGSEPVTDETNVLGADIKNVRYVLGSSGAHCFFIEVYGDGKQAVTEVSNYVVDVEVGASDGWGAHVEFLQGEPEPGRVFLGPLGPGRDILEGAEVSVEWVDDDTMKVTVTGTGTELNVGAFDVAIFVFMGGDSFYDQAEGTAES